MWTTDRWVTPIDATSFNTDLILDTSHPSLDNSYADQVNIDNPMNRDAHSEASSSIKHNVAVAHIVPSQHETPLIAETAPLVVTTLPVANPSKTLYVPDDLGTASTQPGLSASLQSVLPVAGGSLESHSSATYEHREESHTASSESNTTTTTRTTPEPEAGDWIDHWNNKKKALLGEKLGNVVQGSPQNSGQETTTTTSTRSSSSSSASSTSASQTNDLSIRVAEPVPPPAPSQISYLDVASVTPVADIIGIVETSQVNRIVPSAEIVKGKQMELQFANGYTAAGDHIVELNFFKRQQKEEIIYKSKHCKHPELGYWWRIWCKVLVVNPNDPWMTFRPEFYFPALRNSDPGRR